MVKAAVTTRDPRWQDSPYNFSLWDISEMSDRRLRRRKATSAHLLSLRQYYVDNVWNALIFMGLRSGDTRKGGVLRSSLECRTITGSNETLWPAVTQSSWKKLRDFRVGLVFFHLFRLDIVTVRKWRCHNDTSLAMLNCSVLHILKLLSLYCFVIECT